nr:BPK_HP1_G0000060.mRNA.1.CDS.1 [Saccharomyces cerevisiae]
MLAKTGDVVVQKVPVIRLSVFLHFFCFSFCLCTAYIWKTLERYSSLTRRSNSRQNRMLIDFAELYSRDLRKRASAFFHRDFVSHVPGENNCRPRRSEIRAAVRFRDRKEAFRGYGETVH